MPRKGWRMVALRVLDAEFDAFAAKDSGDCLTPHAM
jgi:hypothetical protein